MDQNNRNQMILTVASQDAEELMDNITDNILLSNKKKQRKKEETYLKKILQESEDEEYDDEELIKDQNQQVSQEEIQEFKQPKNKMVLDDEGEDLEEDKSEEDLEDFEPPQLLTKRKQIQTNLDQFINNDNQKSKKKGSKKQKKTKNSKNTINESEQKKVVEKANEIKDEIKLKKEKKTNKTNKNSRRKNKSKYWKYFELIEDDKVLNCKLCKDDDVKLKYHGNTTVMKNHLESFHEDILKQDETQQTINGYLFNSKEIQIKILKYIILDNRPLSTFQSSNFQDIFSCFSNLNFPSKYLVSIYIQKIYDLILFQLKEQVKDTNIFNIELDHCTSTNNKSFISVSMHLINKKFQNQVFNIRNERSQGDSSQIIYDQLKQILKDLFPNYNDQSQICCTLDGFSANKALISKTQVDLVIVCLCHVIINSVNDAFSKYAPIDSIYNKVKKISSFFKKSPKMTTILQEQMKKKKLQFYTLKSDNKTRWTSKKNEIESVIQNYECISEIMATNSKLQQYQLTIVDISILNQIYAVMVQITEILCLLQKRNVPTMAYAYVINEIDKYMQFDYNIEQYESDDRDPVLEFWYRKEEEFPFLVILAKQYLALQATSCETERVFSGLNNLITQKRNQFNDETVSQILFIQQNIKFQWLNEDRLWKSLQEQI